MVSECKHRAIANAHAQLSFVLSRATGKTFCVSLSFSSPSCRVVKRGGAFQAVPGPALALTHV